MEDKAITIAYITIFLGITLIVFTFIIAFIYLINNPSIAASFDLIENFGYSLSPLIEATIRIMYLGVMGWIGLVLTTRGVQLLSKLTNNDNEEEQPTSQKEEDTEQQTGTEKNSKT